MANESARVSPREADSDRVRRNASGRPRDDTHHDDDHDESRDTKRATKHEDATHKDAARDVAREAGDKAREVKGKALHEAAEARDELRERAQGVFTEFREALADQIERVARVLRRSEREMHEQDLDELADYPRRVADGIEDVTDYIRARSAPELRRDFERAVAARPAAVMLTLAAVGGLTAWYLRNDGASGQPSRRRGRDASQHTSANRAGSEQTSAKRRGTQRAGTGEAQRTGSRDEERERRGRA